MANRLLRLLEPPLSRLDGSDAAKLGWLLRLRWIAIVAQAGSIPPAVHFGLLEERLIAPFVAVIAALALLSLGTDRALRRGARIGERHLGAQLFADIAALSVMLSLSGGAWNPLVPLLFFHAGLGALLLEGRVSLAFFWSLVLCLAAVQAFGHVPPALVNERLESGVLFPAQFLVAGVFWLFTSWLSRTLSALQAGMHAQREERGRIDRLRAVGALAAGLSHEFATPLNVAILKLERLGRKLDLADHPALQEASDALGRCEDVLRQMAGSQLRPDGLRLEVADVAELVAQACAAMRADEPDAPLRFRASSGEPALVIVPTIAFARAVLNLVENALEESSADSPVEVDVKSSGSEVVVDVRDHGPGWPALVRSHLGEPFVTTRESGVGLGLYFAYTLAQAVGGSLELIDPPSGGALARMRLPRAPLAAQAVRP